MPALNRYDSSLQMFVEDQRDPDMQRLRFLRWLAERGGLEHSVAGVPSGDLIVTPTHITSDPHDASMASSLKT
jgi:hypothetical protein